MDRQTDRWTEGRTCGFPLALGGSGTQTGATPVWLSLQHDPVLWQKSESPMDQLAPPSFPSSQAATAPQCHILYTHNAHFHTLQPLPTEEALPAGAW